MPLNIGEWFMKTFNWIFSLSLAIPCFELIKSLTPRLDILDRDIEREVHRTTENKFISDSVYNFLVVQHKKKHEES